MTNKARSETPFHVGDQVSFPFGLGKAQGAVVEDRGPIGVGGRHLYRIRYQFEPDEEAMFTERPASDLELVTDSSLQSTRGS